MTTSYDQTRWDLRGRWMEPDADFMKYHVWPLTSEGPLQWPSPLAVRVGSPSVAEQYET